jgi:ABC-type transport system involved in cytochrome bd biosynthesis fused ATPase/permease subunit
MVTHDAALAAAADVVLRIDGGRLAEEDSPARRGREERHALSR